MSNQEEHNTLHHEDAAYLLSYINNVLIPASKEFFELLDEDKVMLHHAFSFTTILTHAIDYMIFIAKKIGSATRTNFIKEFDEKYYVDRAIHINNKFRLLDAINNSFKHVELDQTRYPDLIEQYGKLSFHSLKPKDGKIYFEMPSYKFDYCRVVLRPIAAIFKCDLKTTRNVIEFIEGKICGSTGYGNFSYEYEPRDAIDRMIDYCSASCVECGESDKCECENFIYDNKKGQRRPDIDPKFDFDDVMSKISGTREWSK